MKISYIFLDANFLLIPAQFNIDIYSKFEGLVYKPLKIIILSAIFKELELKISKTSKFSRLRKEYRLSRQILEKIPYDLVKKEKKTGQKVDDLLVEYVERFFSEKLDIEEDCRVFIATNDRELKKKCKKNHIKVIYLRKKKMLCIK